MINETLYVIFAIGLFLFLISLMILLNSKAEIENSECKKCECKKRHYKVHSIYSVTPAPWGDSYRYLESFEVYEDAVSVWNALEKVNIMFNCYKIVEETRYL